MSTAKTPKHEPDPIPRRYQKAAEAWVRRNPPPPPSAEQKALVANLLKRLR